MSLSVILVTGPSDKFAKYKILADRTKKPKKKQKDRKLILKWSLFISLLS
jgi:hypothetical protein